MQKPARPFDARWDLALWNLSPSSRDRLDGFMARPEFDTLAESDNPPNDWSDRLFVETQDQNMTEFLDLGILHGTFAAALLQGDADGTSVAGGRMASSKAYADETGIPGNLYDTCLEMTHKRSGPPLLLAARSAKVQWKSSGSLLLVDLINRVQAELEKGPISDIIILPSLGVGGAERVGYWHYRLLKEGLGRNPLLLLADHPRTEAKYANLRAMTLVDDAEGPFIKGRGPDILLQCISALVSRIAPETVHVVQSFPGFLWLESLAANLMPRSGAKHIASFFCAHTHGDGTVDGYHLKIPYLEGILDNYVVDNRHFVNEIRTLNALPESTCSTLDYPVEQIQPIWPSEPMGDRPGRVLWAARFDHQKQPQIVPQIAALMPDVEFHMYGTQVMGDTSFDAENLPPNVFFHGPFSNFFALPIARMDLYLNTAFFEGLPQALAEASSVGLPVVASAVGGVPEIIGAKNGRLVHNVSDPAEYATAIRELLDPSVNARARAATLKMMIEKRSFEVFCQKGAQWFESILAK